jgi:hypothetical protein
MVGVLDEAVVGMRKGIRGREMRRRGQQWSDWKEKKLYRTTRRQREDQSPVVAVDIDCDGLQK